MDETELQKLTRVLYEDLHGLIHAMAWDITNNDRWQLNHDEVYQDLSAELVRVVSIYRNKPYNELYRLVITSLRNRKSDLLKTVYLTHRQSEQTMQSLDDMVDTVGYTDSSFDMDGLLSTLSSDAKKLVFEVIYPSSKTLYQLDVSAERKRTVSNTDSWKISITPLILRRSLGWNRKRVEMAWKEVSAAIAAM